MDDPKEDAGKKIDSAVVKPYRVKASEWGYQSGFDIAQLACLLWFVFDFFCVSLKDLLHIVTVAEKGASEYLSPSP